LLVKLLTSESRHYFLGVLLEFMPTFYYYNNYVMVMIFSIDICQVI